MSESAIADLLAAAGERPARPLGSLIERMERTAQLRELHCAGRPMGAPGAAGVSVAGVTEDSRRARAGWLFAAVPGEHVDGHDFVGAAERAGAVVALVERPVLDVALPQLVVAGARRALAEAAAWFYDDPSAELGVVGITGTDGKTTTSFLAVSALEAAGLPAGLISTVETKIGTVREANPEHVTTPEAPELQATLRAMVAAGDRVAVLETTSHGLALERVSAIAYDVAVLTNLSHEHLELHGTFEAYRAAKLSLFERLAAGFSGAPPKAWPRAGIVNLDDPSGPLFSDVTREAGARLITYGTDPRADVRATSVDEGARRLRVGVEAPRWRGTLELRLVGRFNVHNALAVVALGEALGLDGEAVKTGLETVQGVPGRMEGVDAGQPFAVIVDYAHSPASLAAVLDILAPLAAARGGGLIAVFGSAGERDTAKRPMMGRVAGERCRLVVVTDEDPRGEDPGSILDAIARGAQETGRRRGRDLLLVRDRKAAIAAAFERARPGDVVLLAGKGHERSIIHADGPRPWDERAAALEALAALGHQLID